VLQSIHTVEEEEEEERVMIKKIYGNKKKIFVTLRDDDRRVWLYYKLCRHKKWTLEGVILPINLVTSIEWMNGEYYSKLKWLTPNVYDKGGVTILWGQNGLGG